MIDIEDIKRFAENDKIAFKTHAIFRMKERTIFADELQEILINGEIIAEYKDDFPLPSCLILGSTESKKKIHAVVAVDKKIEMLRLENPNLSQLTKEKFMQVFFNIDETLADFLASPFK